MKWPNNREWSALLEAEVTTEDGIYVLSLVDCGMLKMPSGKLVCCDPFAAMRKYGNPYIQITSGEYRVIVTLADVSVEHDGSHYREAYASLILNENAKETNRKLLHLTKNGVADDIKLNEGAFFGFGVDAGTACFVDGESLVEGMPLEDEWYRKLFENEKEDSWFSLMDCETHIRAGIANIVLPESKEQNNLVLFHSGWGDGVYPVIGGYDAADNLIAVHIDFTVIPDASETLDKELEAETKTKSWWRFW